jgi:hypothetical protein
MSNSVGKSIEPQKSDEELANDGYSPTLNQLSLIVFNAIGEGRHDYARKVLASYLRAGITNREFLNLAADMLDPPKKGRGRPKAQIPRWHIEIAQFYEVMKKDGIGPRSERIKRLGKMFKMSGRSVERLYPMCASRFG